MTMDGNARIVQIKIRVKCNNVRNAISNVA